MLIMWSTTTINSSIARRFSSPSSRTTCSSASPTPSFSSASIFPPLPTFPLKTSRTFFSLLRCEVDQQSQCRVFQRQRNRFVPPLRRERRQRRFSFERIALFSLLQCSQVLRSSFRFFEETMVTIRISRAPRSHSTSTIPTL